jgi:hypothetical protein
MMRMRCFFVLRCIQESKYVFVFSDLIDAENKSAHKCVGKVFLMIKIGPGFMGSLFYFLIKLWWH